MDTTPQPDPRRIHSWPPGAWDAHCEAAALADLDYTWLRERQFFLAGIAYERARWERTVSEAVESLAQRTHSTIGVMA